MPFKIMFSPEKNPVDVPIVQVSPFDDDTDAAAQTRLGDAVQKLREENMQIIVSGMAVHNLRDIWVAMSQKRTMPYTVSIDRALQEAVETGTHPNFEHLVPIHVGVGAAGEDKGEMVWTMPDGSMS